MNLRNITISDLDDIHDFETSKDTKLKSAKKPLEKGEVSLKSNLQLVQARVVEIMGNNKYKVQGVGSGERGVGSSAPNSQLPTPNSQLPTPNSQLPTSHSQLPTPNSPLPTPNSQLRE